MLPSGECEQDADPIQTAAIRIESRLHSIWISVNRALETRSSTLGIENGSLIIK